MNKLIFATYATKSSFKITKLLIANIRKFGGPMASFPIYVFIPENDLNFISGLEDYLTSSDDQIIPFQIDKSFSKFLFIEDVLATTLAEKFAKRKNSDLAWMTPNSLVLKPPTEFILNNNMFMKYRPVHHTLIGSLYDQPLNDFWEKIFEYCGVQEDMIFPMKTHVDGNTLRPYFNAGCFSIKSNRGVLQL